MAPFLGADTHPPACFDVQDTSHDGFPDNYAGGDNAINGDGGLVAVKDIASDSDADGCSDNYEAIGGCGGNARRADVVGDGNTPGADGKTPRGPVPQSVSSNSAVSGVTISSCTKSN